MFSFSDRKPRGGNGPRQSMLVSYPMFAKFTGIPSVRKIKFERLVLKMKPEYETPDQ
jgi:hypothetical protein